MSPYLDKVEKLQADIMAAGVTINEDSIVTNANGPGSFERTEDYAPLLSQACAPLSRN
jgi:hypothetical protein